MPIEPIAYLLKAETPKPNCYAPEAKPCMLFANLHTWTPIMTFWYPVMPLESSMDSAIYSISALRQFALASNLFHASVSLCSSSCALFISSLINLLTVNALPIYVPAPAALIAPPAPTAARLAPPVNGAAQSPPTTSMPPKNPAEAPATVATLELF